MSDGSVWVKVHPDYAGGGNGTLDPAELLSDPVAVANATAPGSYTVKLTDGTSKKIWFLPGNTASTDDAVYSVTLSAGVLPGVMVGAGGCGGGRQGSTAKYGGAGGAGGVIGQGAHQPVILPEQEAATYTIMVPPTTVSNRDSYVWNGADATIAVQGQEPFATAMGGGRGGTVNANAGGDNPCSSSAGGSGGGGCGWPETSNVNSYSVGSPGLPGQGHGGGEGREPYGGAGGGYGGPGSHGNGAGGTGFDLATALMLDDSDGDTKTFLDLVSVDGWIAGGGATNGGSASGGGGVGGGGHAKDYTGAGGGGHSTYGKGGCGMVLLVTEV